LKLAISQIAWQPSEEEAIAEALQALSIKEIELAPPRIFADPANPKTQEIKDCTNFWGEFDITPVAFQALLFGRPDLTMFGDSGKRQEMFEHLARTIEAAGKLGMQALVFGSPKNRFVPESFDSNEAWGIAVEFFRGLGQVALDNGTSFCIEPNPVSYGCNFVTDSTSGLQLVREVANSGFGLHLDLAGMWLAEEDPISAIDKAGNLLKHFHLSAPDLAQVKENDLPYAEAVRHLSEIQYAGTISIEMRSGDSGNLPSVTRSVEFIQDLIAS
jgi:D-psicose/D-tagatose/L-ribulose 3-epimerase